MTILHASNTIGGINEFSSAVTQNISGARMGNTDYESGGSGWSPTGLGLNPAGAVYEVTLNPAETQFWAAFNHYTFKYSGHTGVAFSVRDGSGKDSISLYYQSNIATLRYWNGSAWTVISGQTSTRHNLGIAGGDLDLNTCHSRFDISLKIHATTGWIKVYRNGLLILSFEGNTVFNSVTAISRVRYVCSSIQQTGVTEFLISTGKTIGQRCHTPTINAAGAVNTFSSGVSTAVDDVAATTTSTDSDFIESLVADQVFTANLTNLVTPELPIQAVVINARALKAAGSPESIGLGVRVGGTNYFGSDQSLATSYGGRKQVFETNPATSAQWVAADIGVLEAALRSRP